VTGVSCVSSFFPMASWGDAADLYFDATDRILYVLYDDARGSSTADTIVAVTEDNTFVDMWAAPSALSWEGIGEKGDMCSLLLTVDATGEVYRFDTTLCRTAGRREAI
jgi:hypothetical protein